MNSIDMWLKPNSGAQQECQVCGKIRFPATHSCSGVPSTDAALKRYYERNGITMKQFEVSGNTQIGFSMVVSAENAEQAREKAKDLWSWNTTSEDIQMDVWDAETGDPA